MKNDENSVEEAGLSFLCETGLDPGLDHMEALRVIADIEASGGKVIFLLKSFR